MAPDEALSDFRDRRGVEGPWLCLVTDRHRLARAAGQPLVGSLGDSGQSDETGWALLREQVTGAVRAGITLIQIRERDLDDLRLLELTRALVAIAAGSSTRVVVNDRLDIALAAEASGVHLRGDSPAPARVRPLAPAGWLLGRSVHGVDEVAQASGADYFVAGTVFPTESKADKETWLGLYGLADIVDAAGPVPVLAIGGITESTAASVAASGVRGLASIGAFLPSSAGEDVASAVERLTDTLRRVFSRAARDL